MALADLIKANPWPQERPDIRAVTWGWGVDGAELLRRMVDPQAAVILEIGSLLGGSARFWAEHCPAATVLCVDPWIDVADVSDRPFLEHVPELVDVVVGRVDGLYEVFLASNWEYRDRIIPLRGFSPDRLASIHAAEVQPDVVYVDGSHVYEDVIADLSAARALFPDALICGDDYDWPAVAAAVGYVVDNRGDRIHRQGNSFVIEQTGNRGRQRASSAMTTAAARRSLPVRVASVVAAEVTGSRPGGLAGRLRSD